MAERRPSGEGRQDGKRRRPGRLRRALGLCARRWRNIGRLDGGARDGEGWRVKSGVRIWRRRGAGSALHDAALAVIARLIRNGWLLLIAGRLLSRAHRPCGAADESGRACEGDLQQQQTGDDCRQDARNAAYSFDWIHRRRLWFHS
jgi:hypothetical protein